MAWVGGRSDGTGGTGVLGVADATSGDTRGRQGIAYSPAGRGVFGLSNGTAPPAPRSAFMEKVRPATSRARASWARPKPPAGGFRPISTNGTGLFGVTTASDGMTYGVQERSDSLQGAGVYGIATSDGGFTFRGCFESARAFGFGVRGTATHGAGVTYGGRFESNSAASVGVIGFATAASGETEGVFGLAAATSGFTFGVIGGSDSTSGRGAYGYASADTGNTISGPFTCRSTSAQALVGWANAESGSTCGVVGKRSSMTGIGYAVYAEGDLGASGFKSFRVDHPDAPENKYLLHYSAESPEVLTIYCDTVTLDARGDAGVELPHYSAKIITRPRCELTAVGMPMPNLYVAERVDGAALAAGARATAQQLAPRCTFRIAGGAPDAEVS